MKRIIIFCAAAAMILMTALPAVSQPADFSGEQIEWIIPFKVGGGSDVWARLYAPFFQKYLTGNPVIAIKNVEGGGSITGGNLFHTRAKNDGLTVFGSSGSTSFPYLLGNSRVKYDFAKYPIIFASPTGGVAYIKPDLGVKSAEDLKGFKGELAYASQGATSLDIVPLLAFDILGLNVKAIFGYKGRGDGRVAFEQGEVNIDYQTTTAFIKNGRPLVEQGLAVPLMTWGILDNNGMIVRDPIEPDLPTFKEVYAMVHGKEPSGQAWEAWKAFFIAGFGVQKAMWLPEGTDPAIVEAYREAAGKIIVDEEFKTVNEKSLGGYPQLAGSAARIAFGQVLNVPKADKQWVVDWIKEKWGVTIE
ncbi:MAG: Bug family tripartite tricarboxylate transporter substrate binding protein [Desulfobacterales bacterium]